MARPYRSRSFDSPEETPASTEELRRWLRSDSEVSGLTTALEAHGAGVTSANLALDLVLNEIVRQACLATAATGAAIALLKDGEMVCCATAGASAPELGARLDKKSGLSAICLRTKEAQRCDDTVIDARVNASACRLLGVRSILVMPLLNGDEPFGIFEVFSSLPHAFGDRDLQTLEALAGRIFRNNHSATASITATKITEFPSVSADPPLPLSQLTSTDYPIPDDTVGYPADIAAIVESAVSSKHRDPWTLLLSALVVVIAVGLLGMMVWRLGGGRPRVTGARSGATPRPSAVAPSTASPQAVAVEVANSRPESVPAVVDKQPPAQDLPVAAPPLKTDLPYTTPPGGLDIYQNGKRIYHQEPTNVEPLTATTKPPVAKGETTSSVAAAQAVSPVSEAALVKKESVGKTKPVPVSAHQPAAKALEQVDPEIAEQFLLNRVEPEYPEAARQKRIQGLVVLHTQVGKDGSVEDLKVLSGHPVLSDAAIAAVRQWRYTPFVKGSKPVPFETQVTLSFALPN